MFLRLIGCVWLYASLGALCPIPGLGAERQKKVVADFEDVGSWRMRESEGTATGTWWPGDHSLGGSDTATHRDDHAGELRFVFDPDGSGPFKVGFDRHKMSRVSGFLDGIEFEAKANGLPVSLRFDLVDATNRTFRTGPVTLHGEEWKHYRLALNAVTLPGIDQCRFPARLKRIVLEATEPCAGSVFLDDITLTGTFTKKDQLSVQPIYDGLHTPPGEPVVLRYRVRNASPQDVDGQIKIAVRDFSGEPVHTQSEKLAVPAVASAKATFTLGQLPVGAYEVVVKVGAGQLTAEIDDTFGVFTPNNGQPNGQPMWFGVCDQSAWQSPAENKRHWQWMHLLGVDINRVGFFPDRFEPERGLIARESWARLIQGHADAGVDVLILYNGTPPWSRSNPARRRNGPPDLLPEFEEHAEHVGAFLQQFPNVRYLEFRNEPDLHFFDGTLEEYLTMLQIFSRGFKKAWPELPFTTGGVTVQHPREKKGFSKGMYQQGAPYYDIAAYHAHGPVNNNRRHLKQVQAWLREAGLEGRPIINTETGERSLGTAEGRRRQAISLVKKVVFSKSVPEFDAYFWFTLQDFWDLDPQADDSFGLVTSDNRAKPAFVAYNALINRLANTTPESEAPVAEGLELYAFRKNDGRYVYAGWPSESRSSGTLWVKTRQTVEVSDMFGAVRDEVPLGSVVPISFGAEPLYLSGRQAGEKMAACPPEDVFLKAPSEIQVISGQAAALAVTFRNPLETAVKGLLRLRDTAGKEMARQSFDVGPKQTFPWTATIPAEASNLDNSSTYQLDLNFPGQELPEFSFPIQVIGTYPIQRVARLGENPSTWPVLDGPAITLDRPEQVFELTYDPSIPAWQGPGDLSATARLVHDGQGVRVRVEVTDNRSGPVQPFDKLWRGDDVQVALGTAHDRLFPVLDLGRSTEGPAVWCSQNANASQLGRWDVPVRVTQEGKVTIYDAYLPFKKLGLAASDKPQPVRWTFLVNENDGQGRVRWIQWKDGIGKNRALEVLGHGVLE